MRKILVINRLGIGDVVLTTPLAQQLKEHIDGIQIGYVVASKADDLLRNHPYIDDVFSYNKKSKKAVIEEIRVKGYDEAIIVDERLSSTLLAWKSGCRLLNKGFEITVGKHRLFKRQAHSLRAIDDFTSYLNLFNVISRQSLLRPVIGSPNLDRKKYIDNWLEKNQLKTKKFALIAAKTAFDNKNWNVKYLASLNEYLNKQDIVPVYTGGPGDYTYIEAIEGYKINIAGKFSLRELPDIARKAMFAVSMCTGPLHILATTDIPIVAIYGPSDPNRWAPEKAFVVQSRLACVPCLRWADCIQKQGETCMDEIIFERVRDVIEKNILLKNDNEF